ncbi:MAG: lipid-A-disaccharide synthase N-terminal domain-containing protein [Bacteroidales bacterium]|nr:lipid-A-disaccharide synthase N-terminal domain-containing protein [Bacteroidales bacterium]HPD96539.1 lipid-A-disaccharide synthase N-terminal domain-containing protein [Tenuifilaceae bacterium]HRX31030.1 lipid-A-disaccharide synthase N-terminal domain-containing protein [Tenuifilaceae bacterium]
MSKWLIFSIGFIAQSLFSSRVILQWIVSERHKKVLTPRLYWQLSLLASFLLFVYGYLRDDFAIMLGQVITYFIYIRNMQLEHEWKKFPIWLRIFLYIFPAIIIIYGFNNNVIDSANLFNPKHISTPLMMLGIIAQVLFTLRFVYQWIYSERRKKSHLPMGFWILSLIGSSLIFIYAIFRKDPVLLLGHGAGLIMYSRNAFLLKRYGD